MSATPAAERPAGPLLLLAADHRARGMITIERYSDYLAALEAALPSCDGVLATVQPLVDLSARGAVRHDQRTYLSLNRTGLAGTAFELDDRPVTTVRRAVDEGCTGVKVMTRIAPGDPQGAAAVELLGHVLDEAHVARLDVLVEPVVWRDGRMSRVLEDVVLAAVVAHDLGAPLLKVPVPETGGDGTPARSVERVVASVGVPVLFLGGPHTGGGRDRVLDEARGVMAGGGAGLAIGRSIIEDPDPAGMAGELAAIVHRG